MFILLTEQQCWWINLAKPNDLCWIMSLNMSNVDYEFICELHWISQPHEIVSNQFQLQYNPFSKDFSEPPYICVYCFCHTNQVWLIKQYLCFTSTTTDKTFPIEWTKVTMDNIYSMTSKLIIDGICSKQRTKTLERLFKNNSLIILNLIALTSFALFTYNYLLNQFFRIGSLGLCYLFS